MTTSAKPRSPTRRGLMALLGLGPAVAVAQPPAAAKPAPRPVRLLDTHLAGSAWHRHAALAGQLGPGTGLTLRREPDNPHDRRAIAVLHDGQRIGYVPRAHNRIVATLMDAGETVTATYTARPQAPGYDPRIAIDLVV